MSILGNIRKKKAHMDENLDSKISSNSKAISMEFSSLLEMFKVNCPKGDTNADITIEIVRHNPIKPAPNNSFSIVVPKDDIDKEIHDFLISPSISPGKKMNLKKQIENLKEFIIELRKTGNFNEVSEEEERLKELEKEFNDLNKKENNSNEEIKNSSSSKQTSSFELPRLDEEQIHSILYVIDAIKNLKKQNPKISNKELDIKIKELLPSEILNSWSNLTSLISNLDSNSQLQILNEGKKYIANHSPDKFSSKPKLDNNFHIIVKENIKKPLAQSSLNVKITNSNYKKDILKKENKIMNNENNQCVVATIMDDVFHDTTKLNINEQLLKQLAAIKIDDNDIKLAYKENGTVITLVSANSDNFIPGAIKVTSDFYSLKDELTNYLESSPLVTPNPLLVGRYTISN